MEKLNHMVLKNKTFWDFKGEVDYVDGWFLMRTPVPLLLITLGYWLLVLKLGPHFMRTKSAVNSKNILALYNVFQIGISCYLCCKGTKLLWTYGFINTFCMMQGKEDTYRITSALYLYFFAKLTELTDTVFFVIKKNYRQITFLHVYHHSTMLWNSWAALKYEPTHNTVFLGTLNSYVHVVMYTYYCLSAFPEMHKYLWWKKYITKMQIIQFLLIMIHAAINFWLSECPPSYILLASILLNAIIFLGLFTKFYFDAYKKSKNIRLKE